MPKRIAAALGASVAALAAATAVLVVAGGSVVGSAGSGGSAAPAVGVALDRAVPNFALVDEHGRATSLAAFRGRVVVLAPVMTLCHETCPMTGGALIELQRELAQSGLADQAALVEVSVDPWRDTPARLRAYRRRTGLRLPLFTGTQEQLRAIWRYFGVFYRRVPETPPVDIDWWTGLPQAFDVQHSDGLFFLDARGRERIAVPGPADPLALPPALRSLLNQAGRERAAHARGGWTVPAAAQDLLSLIGRPERAPRAPTLATALARLDGSPPALAVLHREHGELLAGGVQAFRSRIDALRGRPVVVNEWASWCPPCRAELPLLARAAASFGRRVAFLGLDVQDDRGSAARFLAGTPVSYPSYTDPQGEVARAASALPALPETVFYDRSGRLVHVHPGAYASIAALWSDISTHAR